MPRTADQQSVFFRHDGAEQRDVYLRIAPTALRFQQSRKGSVTETLGGYFRDTILSRDGQYSGLLLPDFTIEATSGVAYRQEWNKLKWIWEHQHDLKADGTPADTYFHDTFVAPAYLGIERGAERIYLISIENVGVDDTAQNPYELKITFRCKVLRDLLSDLEVAPPLDATALPSLQEITSTAQLGTTPELSLDTVGTTVISDL